MEKTRIHVHYQLGVCRNKQFYFIPERLLLMWRHNALFININAGHNYYFMYFCLGLLFLALSNVFRLLWGACAHAMLEHAEWVTMVDVPMPRFHSLTCGPTRPFFIGWINNDVTRQYMAGHVI